VESSSSSSSSGSVLLPSGVSAVLEAGSPPVIASTFNTAVHPTALTLRALQAPVFIVAGAPATAEAAAGAAVTATAALNLAIRRTGLSYGKSL
jgi:hypothetical protein